jgi:BTB/POZ domain-containing protein KCTD9
MAKKRKPGERRTLAQTWRKMAWGRRPLIDHHAGYEREGDPADITFFRTGWEGADLSDLTMPRQYVNRSGFEGVSFRNTDLNQSFMCWNDFDECDFTDADLACCDMRASVFRDCSFVRCRLVGADLRGSDFEGCDFTDADLTGARVDSETDIEVSDEQMAVMDCCDEGPQPKGG